MFARRWLPLIAVSLSAFLATAPAASQPAAGRPKPASTQAGAKPPPHKPDNKPKHAPPAAHPPRGNDRTTPSAPRGAEPHPGTTQLTAPSPRPLELSVERVTLDNGLRIVLSPDHTLPSIAITIGYAAGSEREAVGQNGFARLLATIMMEGGSDHFAPGEQLRQVRAQGGGASAVVTRDLAMFSNLLPSSALELGLWLEAARMRGLQTGDDAIETAKRNLREYREPATLTPQLALARNRIDELAFQGYWPYEHADAALPNELVARWTSAVRDFHRAWYTPGNAVLALSGDFDPDEAIRLVRHLFGEIPKRETPPQVADILVPDQTNQRSTIVQVPEGTQQGVVCGWTIPAEGQPEYAALAVAASILSDRSRFGTRVRSDRLRRLQPSTDLQIRMEPRRGHGVLTITLAVPPGANTDDEKARLDAAIDELARLGPSAEELRYAWSDVELRFLVGMESPQQRSLTLARAELVQGDAGLVRAVPATLLAVTRDDVRKAVARHLTPSRRSVVEVRGPKPPPPPPPSNARPAAPPASPAHPAAGGHGAAGRHGPGPAGHATSKPARKNPSAAPPKKKNASPKPRNKRP